MRVYLATELDEHHFEITVLFDTPSDKRYKYLTSDECLAIEENGYSEMEWHE